MPTLLSVAKPEEKLAAGNQKCPEAFGISLFHSLAAPVARFSDQARGAFLDNQVSSELHPPSPPPPNISPKNSAEPLTDVAWPSTNSSGDDNLLSEMP
jgi:hypothetical protein